MGGSRIRYSTNRLSTMEPDDPHPREDASNSLEEGDGGPESDADAVWLIRPGAVVDHYKVQRLLGRGGMGEVYLARDTALGRKVALKVLRSQAIGSQEAVDRFLDEARTTARFSHPHIVTVYGAGLHWGNPFVALEYLEGQTLRQRLDEERPGIPEAIRTGLAIADALQEAHQHQILHRDLKPDNVMIPRDGRLRVLDFGLARAAQEDPGDPFPIGDSGEWYDLSVANLSGTPRYMAPEQWLEQPLSAAADVWSLGLILFELVEGTHPYADLKDVALIEAISGPEPVKFIGGGLPDELRAVIERCLRKDPARRPGAAEIVATLERLLAGGVLRRAERRAPFRGLVPCDEQDAGHFHGRDVELDGFLERFRHVPVLPVVGPSGAGKSSFVFAGVIPRLRERGPQLVLNLRPGRTPLRNLAARVLAGAERQLLDPSGAGRRTEPSGSRDTQTCREEAERTLAQELRQSPARLALELAELAERHEAGVLLFVDQLEELYTLVEDRDERRAFMTALCTAADDPRGPVRATFTLRDDYLGRLAEGDAARDALGHVIVLRSPDPAALQEILTRPLQDTGFDYDDPALVDEMVAAVEGEPAALPLLQVAGQMLWERRDRENKVLLRSAYGDMGGIAGALAHHADGVLEGLPPGQLSIARHIFLRLVAPGEGGLKGHRIVVARGELLDGLEQEANDVLDRLIQGRLVTVRKARGTPTHRDSVRDESELELVHESLIHTWQRLSRWIEEGHEELAFLEEVVQAARLWQRRGERREELWQGAALADARRRSARLAAIPEPVRRFLDAARARERKDSRRRRTLTAGGAALLGMVALVMTLLALQASHQRRQADAQRLRAEQRQAEVQREGARTAIAGEELLEARARVRESLELQDSALARALWWQLQQHPLRWQMQLPTRVLDVAFSPDGRFVAASCIDNTIRLVDVSSQSMDVLSVHSDKVPAVTFTPDGQLLASGSLDGDVVLTHRASGKRKVLEGHEAPVFAVEVGNDGAVMASADAAGVIRLWDVSSGKELSVLRRHTAQVTELAFAPGDKQLASASKDGTVRLWDLDAGTVIRTFKRHDSAEFDDAVAFSPDGKLLAHAGDGDVVRLVDLKTGRVAADLAGHTAAITSVHFSPDGTLLASSGQDETVRLWDVATRTEQAVLHGHSNWVNDLAFSPDGTMLVSGGRDRDVRLWNVSRGAGASPAPGHTADTLAIGFSPDGKTLVSGGNDQSVRLWDVTNGRQQRVLGVQTAEIPGVTFSPDMTTLAVAAGDSSIRLLEAASGTELRVLRGEGPSVIALAFSPDGTVLHALDGAGTIRRFDASTGVELSRRSGGGPHSLQGRFNQDLTLSVAAGNDGAIRVWKVASGQLAALLRGHQGRAVDAAFSPDGKRVVSAGHDQTIRIWDWRSGNGRILGRIAGQVFAVTFHPDGKLVGAAGSDGSIHLFDVADGSTRELGRHFDSANSVRFSPDGTRVGSSAEDGTVQLWELPHGRPLWSSPLMTHSPPAILTHRGWACLDPLDDVCAPPASAIATVLAEQTRIASQSPDGRTLCLQTHGGQLQIWDLPGDERQTDRTTEPVARLEALDDGCLVLTDRGDALLVASSGAVTPLDEEATAVAAVAGRILVATGDDVVIRGAGGRQLDRLELPSHPRISTLTQHGSVLLLGQQDGTIEPIDAATGMRTVSFQFEDAPDAAVTRLLATDDDLLAAGFADGSVGLWSLEDGTRLLATRLYGPVAHMLLRGDRFDVATAMGDTLSWDLGVFRRDYCALMEDVWDQVPVVWTHGEPVVQARSVEHGCVVGEGR